MGWLLCTVIILVMFKQIPTVYIYVKDECPNGSEIYAKGISDDGKKEVVEAHNNVRKDIANGRVAGQPRGINLKRMEYDVVLGEKARAVSNTCELRHNVAVDSRWSWIGQNIFIQYTTQNKTNQNWTLAVQNWFDEHKDFTYPSTSAPDHETGHYTQVVWATTSWVGCDYIHFKEKRDEMKDYPFTQLYTCNYAPGGNIIGEPPYATGTSGCENLC